MSETQWQQTLEQAVSYEGIALHTGKRTKIVLRPAEPGTGYVFIRADLADRPQLPFAPASIGDTVRNTSLQRGDVSVKTVEHLVAALAGLQVDNCLIEVYGEEPPVGDGSAGLFVDLLREAGIVQQNAERAVRTLPHPVYVRDGDRYMAALPAEEFRVTYTFVTNHPVIGTQFIDIELTPETFVKEIARARTIGFLEQIEEMRRQGLALGGSREVAVVVDRERVLTPLRFSNEIVRHKVLDLVGDLAVLGPLRAHIIAVKTGHAQNAQLSRNIAGVL